MQLSHRKAIIFSGMVWFGVGLGLLYKGLNLIINTAQSADLTKKSTFFHRLAASFSSAEEAALIVIAFALLLGFIKGRVVLSKTVARVVKRIIALPEPFSVKEMYAKSYYFLIGGMILLGISMRWMPIGADMRGLIDVAIGSALANGAVLYFRNAFFYKANTTKGEKA